MVQVCPLSVELNTPLALAAVKSVAGDTGFVFSAKTRAGWSPLLTSTQEVPLSVERKIPAPLVPAKMVEPFFPSAFIDL